MADSTIAYFSMEIALEAAIPTYSGGLGVLAGDTVRSAADANVPMVVMTLLHRKGYFYQQLEPDGRQIEEPVEWVVEDFMMEMPQRVELTIEGRNIVVRAWRYEIRGSAGQVVPVYLLDTDLPENSDWDRTLTHYLYGGDNRYRLCQEAVLGIGGVRMLRELGYNRIRRFHMNEGHASLLTLELLEERIRQNGRKQFSPADIEAVREQCVFTTHTPVAAGHDKFSLDLVAKVLGRHPLLELDDIICCEGRVNMTHLALTLSHYVNGVAKSHGAVSREMLAPYKIDSITNGVHAPTWTSEPFQRLFDRHIQGWRDDVFSLRYALGIPPEEVWQAHTVNKLRLIETINRETNAGMDKDHLTIGFARRAAAYKRADLLFHDTQRLEHIAHHAGPIQIIYAGKAHPKDLGGKGLIERIFQAKRALKEAVRVAYIENYDMALAKLIVPGVDIWLNTPKPPMEASGTSGMKAALNGVPSLSTLDGWWLEGCIEGVTGWAIGPRTISPHQEHSDASDARDLYSKLENVVVPMFYSDREQFINIMRHCIALNGSFFHTQRMIHEYIVKAYF